jgi:hypothetical protein
MNSVSLRALAYFRKHLQINTCIRFDALETQVTEEEIFGDHAIPRTLEITSPT